ncbi:4-(cytidine 5'-diphospho)-2-C-methyl-D-erythritol kinase [bacterium]|nr:4-(cytidine 5'-diphospho)-2-C-methyl-D-erythritol kinase [bacterium]
MIFPITAVAPAKINLFLDILDRRSDGYHNLRSVMQTVSLCDELEFSPGGEGVSLSCNRPDVPVEESNLVVKAIELLRSEAKISPHWHVKLEKRIPMGAGLGGGSADAAATLRELCRQLRVRASRAQLLEWGMRLGSEVPFALAGGTALVEGRGERVLPLRTPARPFWYALVSPPMHCPTAELYAALPAHEQRPHPPVSTLLSALASGDLAVLGAHLFNAFEPLVFSQYPVLEESKRRLLEWGPGAR